MRPCPLSGSTQVREISEKYTCAHAESAWSLTKSKKQKHRSGPLDGGGRLHEDARGLGLGASPDDVTFTGAKGVYCEEGSYDFTIGALDKFWRGAENFRSLATQAWWDGAAGMLWAVSQASPLRRVHVAHDLYLWQYTSGDAAGYASGGFLANSELDGALSFGSQQQFYTRNVKLKGDAPDAAWNIVMAGVEGAPAAHCGRDDAGGQPFVTLPRAAAVALRCRRCRGRYTPVNGSTSGDIE